MTKVKRQRKVIGKKENNDNADYKFINAKAISVR